MPSKPSHKPAAKAAPPGKKPAAKAAELKVPAGGTVTAKPGVPSTEDLLAQLSNAVAVSGDEGAVRRLITEALQGHVDDVTVDALGNVLAVKKGTGRGERLLVTAHMDEVGFMITGIDSDGSLRFEIVGGIDERVLLGKPVLVGAKRLPGVMGAVPVHLVSADQRNTVVRAARMRIDIGADSEAAAKKLVKLGDRAGFASDFVVVGPSFRGKALDDRLGCAALIDLLRGPAYSFDLHAAFTVQEEVGLRGAKVAAFAADPQAAFVLDCTPANDLPHSDEEKENTQYNTRLGLGPAIYVADRATISDQRLIAHLQRTAAAAGLPYQLRQPGGGGTDAGAIHLAREGVPSVSVSVPGRYMHTPLSLVRADDWRHTIALMRAAFEAWTPAVLKRKA
jgi:tetrahedral aminopeptidase